jgi:adenylate cyclase
MADIAFANGGTLDKFIGDSVMVLFGAPIESEPHLQVHQCLRMAFAMQRRTVDLNKKWKVNGTLRRDLTSRMGVHIGEATIGSFGSRNRVEFSAIGSTVNLASRLEGECTPGNILVREDAWRYVNRDLAAIRRPGIWVKGFSAPVEAFEIRYNPEEV